MIRRGHDPDFCRSEHEGLNFELVVNLHNTELALLVTVECIEAPATVKQVKHLSWQPWTKQVVGLGREPAPIPSYISHVVGNPKSEKVLECSVPAR